MKKREMKTRGKGKYSQWISRVPRGLGVANQEGNRALVLLIGIIHVMLKVALPMIPLIMSTDELSIILKMSFAHLIDA